MTKKQTPRSDDGPDQGGIGMNSDGTVNVVPPEEVAARLAEIREMRKAEGFDMEDDD